MPGYLKKKKKRLGAVKSAMQNRLKEILPGIQLELFAWLPKIIQLFNKEPEVCFRYRMPKHLCFMNLFTIIEHKKPTIKTQIFKQKIRLNKRKQQLLLANDDHAPYCQQFYITLLSYAPSSNGNIYSAVSPSKVCWSTTSRLWTSTSSPKEVSWGEVLLGKSLLELTLLERA